MSDANPVWIPCECCDEYWCTYHEAHAHQCLCHCIEDWDDEIQRDPYTDPVDEEIEFYLSEIERVFDERERAPIKWKSPH